ncbi:hypothetical protein OIU34_24520 [Pararhizobium sp. BT-229]|uniref:hypothetical protein n=1 Tax=Pararhizobium sp. BT-229 TaxID=2986923 RepID=UPI0021F70F70|nr:hypothetical protein [Pararhizobium sp. BT-229]MCV9965066.1 hypothetical protein [Pararhizobium sp. BT-229]
MSSLTQFATRHGLKTPSIGMTGVSAFAVLFAGLCGYVVYDTVQRNPTQVGSTLLIDNPQAQGLDVMERRAENWKVAITSLQRAIENEVFDADGADGVRRRADLMEAVFEASAIAMGDEAQRYDALRLEATGAAAMPDVQKRINQLNGKRAELGRGALSLVEIRTGLLTGDTRMTEEGKERLSDIVSEWVRQDRYVGGFPTFGSTVWAETIGRHMQTANERMEQDMQGVAKSIDSRRGFDRLLP